MFGFGKQKASVDTGIAPEMMRAMRTMEDDILNVPLPTNTETLQPEPPVDVHSNPAQGAPFFAASETKATPPIHSDSPFLDDASTAQPVDEGGRLASPSVAAYESAPVAILNEPVPERQTPNSDLPQPFYKKNWFLIGVASGLTLLLVGGGLYWWMGRSTEDVVTEKMGEMPVVPTPPVVPPTVPIDLPTLPQTERFSLVQPNIFSLDTETATAEGLRTEILKLAAEVKEENPKSAIEFVVRDQNYNPLAFARFSYLLGIALPETLLATLDETFSLYIFIDAGRPRLGLYIAVKDPVTFQKELAKAEKTLPQAINPLFVDTTTAPKVNLAFRSGTYNTLPTRFANVDSEVGLSLDYATREKEWLIGTSMYTLRSIIDKVMMSDSKTPAPSGLKADKQQ